jgi:hypothetical protein
MKRDFASIEILDQKFLATKIEKEKTKAKVLSGSMMLISFSLDETKIYRILFSYSNKIELN